MTTLTGSNSPPTRNVEPQCARFRSCSRRNPPFVGFGNPRPVLDLETCFAPERCALQSPLFVPATLACTEQYTARAGRLRLPDESASSKPLLTGFSENLRKHAE